MGISLPRPGYTKASSSARCRRRFFQSEPTLNLGKIARSVNAYPPTTQRTPPGSWRAATFGAPDPPGVSHQAHRDRREAGPLGRYELEDSKGGRVEVEAAATRAGVVPLGLAVGQHAANTLHDPQRIVQPDLRQGRPLQRTEAIVVPT